MTSADSAAQIAQSRSAGRTTCRVVPLGDVRGPAVKKVNGVVEASGFRALADGWVNISGADAHAIVTELLHRDLAKQTVIMPQKKAADLATQFLDLAPEPHSYFTNGDWTISEDASQAALNSWDPITDAAFDAGVLCIGEDVAAIFWVEDED